MVLRQPLEEHIGGPSALPETTLMIYHQIRFSLRSNAPKGQVGAAMDILRRLGQELGVVETWCVGRDFGGKFEYGAMYALKDFDAYTTYMHAPLRREAEDVVLPVVNRMISQDLTDDPDPAIGNKIREIHTQRFQGDQALRDLVKNLGSYEGSGAPEHESPYFEA
jgi:hypothetical protein